jgi:hypothetical protein
VSGMVNSMYNGRRVYDHKECVRPPVPCSLIHLPTRPSPLPFATPLHAGFPTIKFFGANKERPEPYEDGERDADSMAMFAIERWIREQPPPEVRDGTVERVRGGVGA